MRRVFALIGLLATGIVFLCRSTADESSAALCSAKMLSFVEAIDRLLTEVPQSVLDYYDPIRTYLNGTRGCGVEAVISISRKSKFFAELSEHYTEYTIVFKNSNVVVSFGLKKTTGDIEVPAAYGRYPSL